MIKLKNYSRKFMRVNYQQLFCLQRLLLLNLLVQRIVLVL